MTLRKVPTSVHGIVDYVAAPVLIAAPDIFRMRQLSPAAIAPRVTGAAAAAYSALTDYELGVRRLIPMRVHLALDAVGGTVLGALPWVTGSARNGKRYWLPHALVGAGEIALALTTRTKPPQTKVSRLGRLAGALGR
jgi:hypothetical protein